MYSVMKPRKWNEDQLKIAVRNTKSIRQVLVELGLRPAGGNYVQVKATIHKLKLNIDHFTGKGWNIDGKNLKRSKIPTKDIIVKVSSYQSYKLKNRLLKEKIKKPECEQCGWSKQAPDGRIPLELHHKNGDRYDNRLENLIILCPNCHSLEPTHRGLNSKK